MIYDIKFNLQKVKLFINDKLQDVYFGIISAARLVGKLTDGKKVKAIIGGDIKMHCCIFVDNELVLED